VAGIRLINLPKNWFVDASFVYAETDGESRETNFLSKSALQAAFNGTLPGFAGVFFNPFIDQNFHNPTNQALLNASQIVPDDHARTGLVQWRREPKFIPLYSSGATGTSIVGGRGSVLAVADEVLPVAGGVLAAAAGVAALAEAEAAAAGVLGRARIGAGGASGTSVGAVADGAAAGTWLGAGTKVLGAEVLGAKVFGAGVTAAVAAALGRGRGIGVR